MEEVNTGAVQDTAVDAGAASAPITGEELYEKYENGASIEDLNEMLERGVSEESAPLSASGSDNETRAGNGSHAIAVGERERERSVNREQRTADGAETNNSSDVESGAEEPEQQQEEATTQQEAAPKERMYTQKDFDRVIGRRVGEEQRRQAALLEDLAAVLGVEKDKVAETVRRQRLEAEAEAQGVQDKELYARARQLEQQQAEFQRQQAANAAFQQKIADLQQQGKAAGVDIVELSSNDAFVGMVNNLYRDPATRENAVKLAYHAVFFDDVVKQAAEAEREKVISTVKAGQMRVDEGAAGNTAGAASKVDVGKLTDDQIADIVARAQNGEKISF